MKLVKTLIAVAAIGVGSQALGEAYPGLEVGFTFREVLVLGGDCTEDAKKIGLTVEGIERAAKLKLLSRGFKVLPKGEFSPTGSYIDIHAYVVGAALRLGTSLQKNAEHFGIPLNRGTGIGFTPRQGTYAPLGIHAGDKKFILDTLEENLDDFILDYLESNLKYEATFKDKKLRDIDRVIKGAVEAAVRNSEVPLVSQGEWYKRYFALTNPKKPTAPEGNLENDLLPRRLPPKQRK
jgi:hypothetical protein